ncbi:MAG: hypothetical protein NZ899_05170 [Thermoguttaceae bacterium]|nr:hypothetical protein [Thermoguttaceae bacterium]MDW8078293.1 hypothetical protein [Thermoguttaceae bacterium]
MKPRWIVGLALVVSLLGAAAALAQPPGPGPGRFGPPGMGAGGFGFGGGLLGLLRLEQVQKELGITEEQRNKLQEVGRQLMEEGRGRFQGLRDLPEDQRRARFAELMEQSRQRVEEAVKQVLSEQQVKRLKQIELQQALQAPGGVRALTRKDVVDALGLSGEQVEKINALAERIQEQMREAFRPGAGPEAREQMRQRMEQLRTEARAEVEKILTAEQLGKLKELLGEPFRLEMPRFGPPRGEGAPPQGGEGGRRGRVRGGERQGAQT